MVPPIGKPLRTEIWYPATNAARNIPVNRYSDFLLRGFGAATTMNVIERDKRVKAATMLAPGGPVVDRTNFSTPILMMIGTEDSTIREAGNAQIALITKLPRVRIIWSK